MSEYQYYEFRAIDRPLDRAAKAALRAISSRAEITATSFTNHYEWGDLKGDPRKLVEQWFDLHVYVADWGSRRLIIRLPGRFLDLDQVKPFVAEIEWIELCQSGDNVIIDIAQDDEDQRDDEWDDGSGWLENLAPLRADLIDGDLRLFYLLWLSAVQEELIPDDESEPLSGIGPLTSALESFAAFFHIDPDLVAAAAETGMPDRPILRDEQQQKIAALPDHEKIELLLRVVDGDPYVAAELRSRVRQPPAEPPAQRRPSGVLRARAGEIAAARERADAERREAERRHRAAEAEAARRARLESLKQRGAAVWREVETEIERRNAAGYDRAVSLLADLQALASQEGEAGEFAGRLAAIRARHDKKGRFIERLRALG